MGEGKGLRSPCREFAFRVVVAIQQRSRSLKEPFMLLDRMDYSRAADTLPYIPFHPPFAVAPCFVSRGGIF